MGLLAENKSRCKINKDPNNTKWTRDTTTFGQKILRAQGWQPGQFLGAQDAAHSDFHGAANASYIRVALKDDMKGLGFNNAKQDQVTGLDVFSDLLSRLNGKSEDDIQSDQQSRLVMKTHQYVEAKWGPMRFVRGGLLIGDEMKEEPVVGFEGSTASSDAEDKPTKSSEDKRSRKRRVADLDDSETGSGQDAARKREKKRRKEERRTKKLAAETENDTPDEESRPTKKKDKKDKSKSKSKSKSKLKSKSSSKAEDITQVDSKKSKKNIIDMTDKKKRKIAEEAGTGGSNSVAASVPTSTPTTGTSTPTPGSRNFVRSRYIAQKRQAVLDTKALAQIFMIKT
ncbi:telomerase inhibitor [Conoideocrella luteorostrata]|uniref:PinX1-related protein 1 n=1 Tax=Conoideocrella luteorostrata TaxID=1105319 RepID=A0AAJ0FUV1_9HYPO|nr:telomerase inhibitor [Conoideocrella luteorostrata]